MSSYRGLTGDTDLSIALQGFERQVLICDEKDDFAGIILQNLQVILGRTGLRPIAVLLVGEENEISITQVGNELKFGIAAAFEPTSFGNIIPAQDLFYVLGTALRRFLEAHVATVQIYTVLALDAAARVTGHLIPSADATYNLGSGSNKWNDVLAVRVHCTGSISTNTSIGAQSANIGIDLSVGGDIIIAGLVDGVDVALLKADYDLLKADYDLLKADYDLLKADYDSKVDQDVRTTASPTFAGLTSTGDIGANGDVFATNVNFDGVVESVPATLNQPWAVLFPSDAGALHPYRLYASGGLTMGAGRNLHLRDPGAGDWDIILSNRVDQDLRVAASPSWANATIGGVVFNTFKAAYDAFKAAYDLFKADYDAKIDQDVRTTASPTHVAMTLSGATASRLLATNGSKVTQSVTIANANGVSVTFSGSTLTCSMTQDLSTAGSPQFAALDVIGAASLGPTSIIGTLRSAGCNPLADTIGGLGTPSLRWSQLNLSGSANTVGISNVGGLTQIGTSTFTNTMTAAAINSGTNAHTCGALSSSSISNSGTSSFTGTMTAAAINSGTNAHTCGALSASSVSSSGLVTATSGVAFSAGQTLDTHYYNSYSGNLTGPATVATTVNIERIGKTVSATIVSTNAVASSSTFMTFSVTLDAQYRPSNTVQDITFGVQNNTSTIILYQVTTGGVLTFYGWPGFGNFTSGQANGVPSGTLKWVLA